MFVPMTISTVGDRGCGGVGVDVGVGGGISFRAGSVDVAARFAAVMVFFWASWAQYESHRALALLRPPPSTLPSQSSKDADGAAAKLEKVKWNISKWAHCCTKNAHLITRIDCTDPPTHLPSPHTDHYRRSRLNT